MLVIVIEGKIGDDINRQCSKTVMQVDRFSLVKQVSHATDELRGLFLDDTFKLEACLPRKCGTDGRTADTMEFIASCAEGSCL